MTPGPRLGKLSEIPRESELEESIDGVVQVDMDSEFEVEVEGPDGLSFSAGTKQAGGAANGGPGLARTGTEIELFHGLHRTGTEIQLFQENSLRDSKVVRTLRTISEQHEIDAWSAEWFETGKIPKGLKKACKQLKIDKRDLEEWLRLASQSRESMGGLDRSEHNPMHENPMRTQSGDI